MFRIRSFAQLTIPFLVLAAFLPLACAQGTRFWNQSRYDEFEKGRPHGVAIRSDGLLLPGPKVTSMLTTPSTYVWAVASDKNGNAYLATGSPATVLKVSPDGKSIKLFETKDLTVQAIAIGPDGSIYAATLPSGKVYKLKADARNLDDKSATVTFDPSTTAEKPKYIWDLTFDSAGRLYVATGAPAAIYRINVSDSAAKPDVFFKSDEQHIRCMTFDREGNLIAGSDGSGLIYRIGKDGKGFILYDAPKREITAVAVGADATGKDVIWASAVGERTRGALPPLPVTGNVGVTANITIVQPGSLQAFNSNGIVADGSEIYEIAATGAPRKLWTDRETVVYALRPTPQGLLVATGNRGRIYRIHESGEFEDLAHLEASQAIGFADSSQGYLVATANTGKLYSLSHTADPEANYESDVFDAGFASTWGRAETTANSSDYDLFARSGNVENPERNWSDWVKVSTNSAAIGVPPARFVQWKAALRGNVTLTSVDLNYLPVNVAPSVDEIVVQPGARVNPSTPAQQQQQSINISFPRPSQSNAITFGDPGNTPLTGIKDKTSVTARWSAHDDNDDELVYSIYFRGDGDSDWRLLKDKVTDKYYSFESSLLPDGGYRVKVVASDSPSHNPGEALSANRVSDRFIIDTAPPLIPALSAKVEGGKIHVTAMAKDSGSPIAHAEYSLDAGPWQYIEPVGQLSDSPEEHYDFSATLQGASGSEHLVTLRVYDRFENVGTAKTVTR
jgi:sugar lactone lactonase YvrE